MKKVLSVLITVVLLCGISLAAGKKRIAVMDLEDKTSGQHSGWHSVGAGMADMLTTTLVKSGKFSVIEREKIEKVMKEQAFGASGAVNAQTAAKIGQILGVQYIVTGSVTEFGIKESKLGVGNLGSILPFGGGVETKTNTAKVAIDIRMIDTSSAEILKAEKGEGEESSTGVSIDLSAVPSVDFGKDGFDETVIGKAVRKAIENVARPIFEAEANLPWSAKIIKVSGKQIYFNSGEEDGMTMGKTVAIFKKGEDLVDPDTGASLGSEETKLGTAKVVKVDKKFSIAETDAKNVTKDEYLKEEK